MEGGRRAVRAERAARRVPPEWPVEVAEVSRVMLAGVDSPVRLEFRRSGFSGHGYGQGQPGPSSVGCCDRDAREIECTGSETCLRDEVAPLSV